MQLFQIIKKKLGDPFELKEKQKCTEVYINNVHWYEIDVFLHYAIICNEK